MTLKFKNNDRVLVHSLGVASPGEYKATIRGVLPIVGYYHPWGTTITDDPSYDPAIRWIVQPDKPIPGCHEGFDCFIVPQACLKLDNHVSTK